MENTKQDETSIEFRLMRLVGYLGVPTAVMGYLLFHLLNQYIPAHEATSEKRISELRMDYLTLQKIHSEQLLKILDDVKDIKLKVEKINFMCERETEKTK